MPLKANYKLGSLVIQIEGEDIKELFQATELLCQCPQKCACGSPNISPGFSRSREGHEFYFLKCMEPTCGKEFKFGQRQRDKGLFPKSNDGWVAPFKGSGEQGGGSDEEWQ